MPDENIMPAPAPVFRCALDRWRFDRGLTVSALAKALKMKQPVLRRYFLDPGDTDFREASRATRKKAMAFTEGQVGMADWPEKPTEDELRHGTEAPPSPRPGKDRKALSLGAGAAT